MISNRAKRRAHSIEHKVQITDFTPIVRSQESKEGWQRAEVRGRKEILCKLRAGGKRVIPESAAGGYPESKKQ